VQVAPVLVAVEEHLEHGQVFGREDLDEVAVAGAGELLPEDRHEPGIERIRAPQPGQQGPRLGLLRNVGYRDALLARPPGHRRRVEGPRSPARRARQVLVPEELDARIAKAASRGRLSKGE